MKQSIYKPFVIFTGILFIIGLLLLMNSPVYNFNWGKWKIHSFYDVTPFIILVMTILTIFVFQREIKLAKTEQLNQDYEVIVKYLEMKLQKLNIKYGLSEEKLNNLMSKIGYLSKLTEIPDLAIYLMEKTLIFTEELQTEFQIQITGSLSALKNINAQDLKQLIALMIMPICNSFNNINTDNKRSINLFIREFDNKITLKVMHDYFSDNPINSETIEWNVKKILHKYGGEFLAINEKEEESNGMFVLSLIVDIPKENKVRKII